MADNTSSQPPPFSKDENHYPLPKDRIKYFFLGIPILSLIVGGTLLLAEVTVIVLMLAVPRSVGVPEHAVLTSVQRGILGGVSIILLIEAVLYGVTDIGTNRQNARKIKIERNIIEKEVEMESKSGDIDPAALYKLYMLNKELNHHTLKYVAILVFELATYLWKWALALIVIRNNWLSVGIAIAGGVIYPLILFWQKAIEPTP